MDRGREPATVRSLSRSDAARRAPPAGRRRAHLDPDHAPHCRRWLVVRRALPGIAGALPGLLLRSAVSAARAAPAVCRLCPLAAGVAPERGTGVPFGLLETATVRRPACPGAAHR